MSDVLGLSDIIRFLQNDLNEIKHTLHKTLKPYKDDIAHLTRMVASLKANNTKQIEIIYGLLAIIYHHAPDKFDAAYSLWCNPNRQNPVVRNGITYKITQMYNSDGTKKDDQ